MQDAKLISTLYNIGAIKFGDFSLKSGQSSQIYIDLRKVISYPSVLRDVADAMWKKISACQFDVLCGVPYTALPIATCLSLQHYVPMVMRRKEIKIHGTKQKIEGDFLPNQTCLIIEDVITTGNSVIETAQELAAEKLNVKDVVVLIDRGEDGQKNLKDKNYTLHAVYNLKDILHELSRTGKLTDKELAVADAYA